jgi:hypothetical protein
MYETQNTLCGQNAEFMYATVESRDSSVHTATGYGATVSRLAVGPIQWVPGTLFPGLKRQGREADHPPLPIAEVKNGGAVSPLSRMSSCHSA